MAEDCKVRKTNGREEVGAKMWVLKDKGGGGGQEEGGGLP